MRPCKRQTGGVKLKPNSSPGFAPVMEMIQNPQSELKLISHKSAYGFMFELIVPPEYTKYLALNKNKQKFTVPVTNFILKIVLIPNDEASQLIVIRGPGRMIDGTRKYFENKRRFLKEVQTQQEIWLTSITGGKPDICPSVANFALLDNDNSTILLNYLYTHKTNNATTFETKMGEVLLYILNEVNKGNTIGIILMPKVINSQTMENFEDATEHDISLSPEERSIRLNKAYANIIAQIVRLYILTGYAHNDLHTENILIQTLTHNLGRNTINIKSQLIDFGNVNSIETKGTSALLNYLFSVQQQPRNIKRKNDEINNKSGDKDKAMMILMNKIYPYPTSSNINWLFDSIRSLRDDAKTVMLTNAFDILIDNMVSEDMITGLLPQTMQQYKKKGLIFDPDVNININDYYFVIDRKNIDLTVAVPKQPARSFSISDLYQPHIPPAEINRSYNGSYNGSDSDTIVEPDSSSRPYYGEDGSRSASSSGTVVDVSRSASSSGTIVDNYNDYDYDDIGINETTNSSSIIENQSVRKEKDDDIIITDFDGGYKKSKRTRKPRTNKSKKKKTRKNNLKKSKTRKNNLKKSKTRKNNIRR